MTNENNFNTNKLKNVPKNPDTIKIDDERELEWWEDYFKINKDKIKDAVNRVGASIELWRAFVKMCKLLTNILAVFLCLIVTS